MSIELEHEFAASADALWAIVGTPDRTDWVPGVQECHFDGEVRRMVMQGAGEVAEKILSLDNDARVIRYSVIESTPPLDEHVAEIQVSDLGSGSCQMRWLTTAKPEVVETFIQQQMVVCIAELEKLLQG